MADENVFTLDGRSYVRLPYRTWSGRPVVRCLRTDALHSIGIRNDSMTLEPVPSPGEIYDAELWPELRHLFAHL